MNPVKRPTVALVGRMNVGKSTLFNRLTESHRAITSSWAGTTRDVNTAPVRWRGTEFDIVDTGGLDVQDDEQLEERVIAAARRAMDEAQVILFVIDGNSGVMPQDKKLLEELRHSKVPVLLVVNKIDNNKKEQNAQADIYKLNMEPLFFVSATNGLGTGDLLEAIVDLVEGMPLVGAESPRTKIAIVGRPNVGKSSFLNAVLNEERVIVADKEHTTRDTNDIPYTYNGKDFLLIDTAGIRRQSNVGKKWSDNRLGAIEKESVQSSIIAMERADVVVLVIEAQKRVTAQDKKISQLAHQYGKGLIIVVNKWDLIDDKDSNTIDEFAGYFDASLPFLRWAPLIFTSATERLRVLNVLDMVTRVAENYERFIEMGDLEEVFAKVKGNYKPKPSPMRKYKNPDAGLQRLKQVAARPPHFYLKAKKPKDVPKAIVRIAERELRAAYDFEGVKIVIEIGQ